MPTPHAHDQQDRTDGPPAPPTAGTPAHDQPRQPFTLRSPRRPGDPADPKADDDRRGSSGTTGGHIDSPEARVRHAVDTARRGGGWVELDVEDLTATAEAGLLEAMLRDRDMKADAAPGAAEGARLHGDVLILEDVAAVRERARRERATVAASVYEHPVLGNLAAYCGDLPGLWPHEPERQRVSRAFSEAWERVYSRLPIPPRGEGERLDGDMAALDDLFGEVWNVSEAMGIHAGWTLATLDKPTPQRLSAVDCTCGWGEDHGSVDGERGTATGAQALHALLLDLEDGGADVWEAVTEHLLTDIDCAPEKGEARVTYQALEEFVADHNWRDPARMMRLAGRLRLLCGYYAGDYGRGNGAAQADRAARLSPGHQELVADMVERLDSGRLTPEQLQEVINDPERLSALSRSYQQPRAAEPLAQEEVTGELVFRDSVEYLLGDLDTVTADVRRILEDLDAGNSAAVVHRARLVRDTLVDDLGDLTERLDHLWHTAGAYALDDPKWSHRRCEQGLTEAESRAHAADAGMPHPTGGRLG